jgi:hypothetical protein
MHESSPVLPTRPAPSLNEAIRQFARWRSARQRGERIPVQLWRILQQSGARPPHRPERRFAGHGSGALGGSGGERHGRRCSGSGGRQLCMPP